MEKFIDLEDALKKMKNDLPAKNTNNKPLILGISDNKNEKGPNFAKLLAQYFDTEFEIFFMSKIHSPQNKQLIIAMISETGHLTTHKDIITFYNIKQNYIYNESKRKHDYLTSSIHTLKENDLKDKIYNRNIYLADYAICTGMKMDCAIGSIIDKKPKSISIITPIIKNATYEFLYKKVDNIFYNKKITNFVSKRFYYEKFNLKTNKEKND